MTQKPAQGAAQDALGVVLDALFNGERSDVPTKDFGNVNIYPAKVKQLAGIVAMFNTILERLPDDQFRKVLMSLSAIQRENIDAGRSPFYMADEHAGNLLLELLNGRSLVVAALSGLADVLPEFLCQFTSLTEKEKFEELTLDEFATIAAGVVAINYGFFTRTLLPIVRSALQKWRDKKNETTQS